MRYINQSLSFLPCVIFVGLLCIFLAGCGSDNSESTVWGRVDAKEIDINSKVPGRVVELMVKEGDSVKAGQIIARIDKRDLEAQRAQVEASIEALEAQSLEVTASTIMQDASAKSVLAQTESSLVKAEADMRQCEADYLRYGELAASGAVSAQLYEQYSTKYEVAKAAYAEAQSNVNKASSGLMITDVTTANKAVVDKKISQAQAQLQQIEISLDETEIKAAFDGIIVQKYVEEGSMISTGTPLVAIQDANDNWVDLKVPETELKDFRLGDKVTLIARDNMTKVQGIITDISKKAEFATQRATSERGDASDIITFNIKIQVNDNSLHPGMRFRLAGGDDE